MAVLITVDCANVDSYNDIYEFLMVKCTQFDDVAIVSDEDKNVSALSSFKYIQGLNPITKLSLQTSELLLRYHVSNSLFCKENIKYVVQLRGLFDLIASNIRDVPDSNLYSSIRSLDIDSIGANECFLIMLTGDNISKETLSRYEAFKMIINTTEDYEETLRVYNLNANTSTIADIADGIIETIMRIKEREAMVQSILPDLT